MCKCFKQFFRCLLCRFCKPKPKLRLTAIILSLLLIVSLQAQEYPGLKLFFSQPTKDSVLQWNTKLCSETDTARDVFLRTDVVKLDEVNGWDSLKIIWPISGFILAKREYWAFVQALNKNGVSGWAGISLMFIPADVNGDHEVNGGDIGQVIDPLVFGGVVNDKFPNNIWTDVNRDGYINGTDVGLILNDIGTVYVPKNSMLLLSPQTGKMTPSTPALHPPGAPPPATWSPMQPPVGSPEPRMK